MNSPIMTPMIAIVIAIFMPLKIAGSANGKRTAAKDCHCDAVKDRHSSSADLSQLAKPTAAEMTTGKKLTKVAKAIRDSLVIPSHTTNSGASAIFGISWNTTRLGYKVSRNKGE